MELALASAFRLRAAGRQPQVTVLEAGPEVLPLLPQRARQRLLAEAAALGVKMVTGAQVVGLGPLSVHLADGTEMASDFTLTVTGARPHGWLAGTGLTLERGFVAVNDRLQSSDPAIFAVGDCADLAGQARPKAGVFAVRAAPVLAHNLRAALTGGALKPFRPQRDYLKLVALGGQVALADKWRMGATGGWVWRLKDRIDRKFMARFADYPAMARPALPTPAIPALVQALAEAPLCGGCGAKVGPEGLRQGLAGLPALRRADVLTGPGDDAAQLVHGAGVQVITTDHLRAFTGDACLMTRIAAVHALGDIWAMGATPQVALSQIILPRMSQTLQTRTLDEILQAAAQVFGALGADVVGGHTSIGAELTLGFTVTGLVQRPVTKAGAKPGDALILTKPIGSGIVMAADMALTRLSGQSLGESVAAALAVMTRPQNSASALLAPVAHAMTDVTGFGLAGHLIEMLDASGCGAELDLGAVPCLPGAVDLASAGVASSLAPANRAAALGRVTGAPGPVTPLLYDPQTGGGLLAAVPADRAEALLAALRQTDPEAAIIGRVTMGAAVIRT